MTKPYCGASKSIPKSRGWHVCAKKPRHAGRHYCGFCRAWWNKRKRAKG